MVHFQAVLIGGMSIFLMFRLQNVLLLAVMTSVEYDTYVA
jgi:hypothetical protein